MKWQRSERDPEMRINCCRMGENLRLKAAQRIIRLESFVVDAQVAKLEKDTSKVTKPSEFT